jgi:predicted phage terminase large subunit-like protein
MQNIDKGILRELCEKDHVSFTRYFFTKRKRQKLILNSHHHVIGKTLDRVFSGEITRLIVNIAPRYTKTEEVVISFIARGFAINPSSEFIHASYADSLVMRNSMTIKDLILHESFQELWPMSLKKDSQSKRAWRIADYDGGLLAVPSGGTITGFGAGLMQEGFTGALVIDDPLKPKDAYSDAMRSKINNQMTDTFLSRLAHKKVPIIVVMQRIHEDDMTGFLLNGGTGEKWHHLCLPCEITDETKIYKKSEFPYGIPIDYDIPNGALWEYKHSLSDLEQMRKSDPYTTAAQYDQRPTPLGGGIFKDEWWHYYPGNVPPDFEFRFITGDTAQKTKEHNDRSVFGCWGVSGNKLYLIDVVKGKWESPELRKVLKEFYYKHRHHSAPIGKLRWVYIEDKSSGTDLVQTLENEMPILPIQRNVDKVTRAMDTVPYMASGKVYIPDDAEWVSDFKDEIRKFTPLMSHKYDDQVDMFMDGVEMGLMGSKNEAGAW